MANAAPDLGSLSETISKNVESLLGLLKQNNLPAPSFQQDGLTEYPQDQAITSLRHQLIDAANDLRLLATGPTESLWDGLVHVNTDLVVMEALDHFDFWHAVPLEGFTTISELAAKINLPEDAVYRVLRYATSVRFFAWGPDSSVRHTPFSAIFAKNEKVPSWLRFVLHTLRPGTIPFAEAMAKYNGGKERISEEPIETSQALADLDRTGKPDLFWAYVGRQVPGKPKDWRATEFAKSMNLVQSMFDTRCTLIDGYDWAGLGAANVVDIGGSSGHDAMILTEAFPQLTVTIQDLPRSQPAFEEHVPPSLRDRVKFQSHDMFDKQDFEADVYMFKMILHDWPDKYCVQFLKNLVPKLRPESRILIIDAIVPPEDALPSATMGRRYACLDLLMLSIFNASERSLKDWEALVAKVDERLRITHTSNLPLSIHNFVEIRLQA